MELRLKQTSYTQAQELRWRSYVRLLLFQCDFKCGIQTVMQTLVTGCKVALLASSILSPLEGGHYEENL